MLAAPEFARLAAIFVLSAGALALAAPPAAGEEDARELLARARQAAGGPAWERVLTMHAVLRIETGGLKGRVESWDDLAGRRYADRYELGPASGASGFDGRVGWEQDSSGQVLPRESAEAREAAIDEAYRRSRAFWFPARWDAAIESAGERTEGTRRFRALKITPKGGRPFELWIDASSFLPDRTIEKGALETRTEIFSDYREVRGIFLPFATRSTNGNEKYDQFLRMESVELNAPVADAAFAVPPPPAPDFSIA